ncbi:alpha/beta-hydrolase [Cryphonectria parasitica EP155]|uniref:Alpha/beta-hydrolase n=1 Tax=Cryphonectria parasitica (strain ATCC 38755 / EP155) TaxID=660469 RepID=A0A9P4Y1L9_CRYP1|nr:alpha/beta-hydrolase [Cryphonectria parasitica EP155]KAF3764682.1 alpha/beta-hydrolase [Cryphonectria parasitica EP155]
MATTKISTITADGVDIFYRHAGPSLPTTPTILLLHGFPSSSHMFRNLIPLLAARGYRVIAPDLPGFGFTRVPRERSYTYTFASLATTVEAFVDTLGLQRLAVYIFDYGAPAGLRLALRRPDLVAALVTQNGNAYAEGLGKVFWAPLQRYWASGSTADREALRAALTLPATRAQYVDGHPNPAQLPPEAWTLDQALLDAGSGASGAEAQLDLFYDYRTNVEMYPAFQRYLRESGVPVLAVWGRNDEIFVPAGAEAFARDVPAERLVVRWLDAGHFALETNEEEVAAEMGAFLEAMKVFG